MTDRSYWRGVGGVFVLFAVMTSLFLHRVPGLMGDEASEGENVYAILQVQPLTIVGERSYIGPLIDYLRVPFVLVFGYTAFPLRVVVLLFSWAFFWLLALVLRRLFPAEQALLGLVFTVFSPAYVTQQRLGWAISLLPFFTAAPAAVMATGWTYRWLAAGLLLGLGLATHILFLPTVVGFTVAALVYAATELRGGLIAARRLGAALLLGTVGFWAGFGSQFAVLQLFTDDQGEPAAVAETAGERWASLPELLVVLMSGSSYIARYTGVELSGGVQLLVALAIGGLAVMGAAVSLRRRAGWLLLAGLVVHTVVLVYMIDRFTLRYFVTLILTVWLLAGLGAGWLVMQASRRRPEAGVLASTGIAAGLLIWFIAGVVLPFLRTGGSTEDFSLANRTDSAAALVDMRPLVACLADAGPVFTENVHIWNRLQYLSHGRGDLTVLAEEDGERAQWLVHYRELAFAKATADRPSSSAGRRGAEDCAAAVSERCPELAHFCVVPAR